MRFSSTRLVVIVTFVFGPTLLAKIHAKDLPPEYEVAVKKGLDWLAKQQQPDGHWEAPGGEFPQAITGLSGLSFLMEGSTLRDGKYAKNIRRAVEWFISRSQPNGMLGDPHDPNEGVKYMYGQGYGVLFLASVYGEEEDREMRLKLEDVLTRAVLFIGQAQSVRGGWDYVSCRDAGGDGDSSSAVTQMQGLRAARNAGIAVPKEIIDKGMDYLRNTTNSDGGVRYSWSGQNSCPALTVAALASSASAGQYESDLVKKWIKYCQKKVPFGGGEHLGNEGYIQFYLAQVAYNLGEDGYAKLFPESRMEERWTWSKFRKLTFEYLKSSQEASGSWNGRGYVGPVFSTAINLTILQLDKGTLPFFQR